MRLRVVALVALSLLLAGCVSHKDETVVPEAPAPVFDDSGVVAPVNVTTTEEGRLYRMDVHDLEFQNELLRTTIVADEQVDIRLRADLLAPGLHHDDGCGAFGITAMNGTQLMNNLVGVAMFGENDVPVIVRAGGEEFVVHGDASAAGTAYGYPISYEAKVTLPAGARLHLDLGGRDASFGTTDARSFDPSQGDGTRLFIEANITGRSHLEPAEPMPIRCGMGPRQLENQTAGASLWIAQGALDAAVGLDTTRGSSLVWASGFHAVDPDVTLHFLDERSGFARWFARSSDAPGHIGIQADSWVEAVPTSGWFLADVHWPALNLIQET